MFLPRHSELGEADEQGKYQSKKPLEFACLKCRGRSECSEPKLLNLTLFGPETLAREIVGKWRVAQAFDLAGRATAMGAPSFRVLCERVGAMQGAAPVLTPSEISCSKQHRTRPCKKRKDGAPSFVVVLRKT
jgi:hypothetical protein